MPEPDAEDGGDLGDAHGGELGDVQKHDRLYQDLLHLRARSVVGNQRQEPVLSPKGKPSLVQEERKRRARNPRVVRARERTKLTKPQCWI